MPTFTGGRDTEIKWSKRAIPKADTRYRKEVHWEVVTDRGAIGLIQKFYYEIYQLIFDNFF